MLVLNRREGQEIAIDVPPSDTPTTIIVRLCEVHGSYGKLGTSAPRHVIVRRAEVDRDFADQHVQPVTAGAP
jgi:sRNA-binding carbon storage regulator CsrA